MISNEQQTNSFVNQEQKDQNLEVKEQNTCQQNTNQVNALSSQGKQQEQKINNQQIPSLNSANVKQNTAEFLKQLSILKNEQYLNYCLNHAANNQTLEKLKQQISFLNYEYNLGNEKKKRGRPRKSDGNVNNHKKKAISKSEAGTDFESFDDDYIPSNLTERRTTLRKNRKRINYAESEEEENDGYDTDNDEDDNNQKIEHIYLSRKENDGSMSYLLRFQDSPQALCQWMRKDDLMKIPNSNTHLQRFNSAPLDISDLNDASSITPVAHKRIGDKLLLLFKFSNESNVIFYWDVANNDYFTKYLTTRVCVILCNPSLPKQPLKEPTESVITTKDGGKIRTYQMEGLKWLLKCWVNGHGSILADEMGLGKTIQVLSFLSYLNKNTGWNGPFLIVVRTNCFKQWCDEIERWTDLKYISYNSGPSQRALTREYQFHFLDNFGNPIKNTISFNILLISYDVFLKDVQYLNNYNWEVLVIDEGHRIKNSQGKKNKSMRDLNVRHRIILTGTPIQNSLEELWTLLRFVSPNYFTETPSFVENEIDSLDQETIIKTRKMIEPHLLRREVIEVEHSLAPKEERVAFVSLTQVQKDLIRLVKLHKLWRLKGYQPSEIEIDSSNETNAIQSICSHPFLVEGAEEYYTKKLQLPRLELLLATSSKFKWLDNVLSCIHRSGNKVLIFSQRVKLLKLLDEYCKLRGFHNQILIGSMSEVEKNEAIAHFSAENSDDFIFLISTRAGSEGLNLTMSNIAIIFDPDWNPQNDLQAEARCHRIGQTQKVDVIRLVTYQTYEHSMFIRAQRKLSLWLTLLGSRDPEKTKPKDDKIYEHISSPPIVEKIEEELNLYDLLPRISNIVNNFSLDNLDILEEPLKETIDLGNGMSDEAFIETFPIEINGSSKRIKRSRSKDFGLDLSTSKLVYRKLQLYGYGQWNQICHGIYDFNETQIQQFSIFLCIYSFRSILPTNVYCFPFLIQSLKNDYQDLNEEILLCSNKHQWNELSNYEGEYEINFSNIFNLKDEIIKNSTTFLTTLEMKLIFQNYNDINKTISLHGILPIVSEDDEAIIKSFKNNNDIDINNSRVIDIIESLKSQLILLNHTDSAYHFHWWTQYEYHQLYNALKNYPLIKTNPLLFHSKTRIVSKTTSEIFAFALQLRRTCNERKKGSISIQSNLHKLSDAPEPLKNCKGFQTWILLSIRDCEDLKCRLKLINLIEDRINTLKEEYPETINWTNYQFKKFLDCLMTYGIDQISEILIETSFDFINLLTVKNIEMIKNGRIKECKSVEIPDYIFDENKLMEFLNKTNEKSESNSNPIKFVIPSVNKITFSTNSRSKKLNKSKNLNDEYSAYSNRRTKSRK